MERSTAAVPEITRFLAGIPPFSILPEAELEILAGQVTETELEDGHNLGIQSQSLVDKVYLVKGGMLELFFEKDGDITSSGVLEKGDLFGGISLLMNSGISVRTVVVREYALVYVITAEIFLDLCTRFEAFNTYFIKTFHGRMFDKSYAAMFQAGQAYHFLTGLAPFSFLAEDELKTAVEEIALVYYSKGTLLFYQEKSKIEYLYIIQKGAVERYYEEGGEKRLRGILGEGDTYGGISMLVNNGISVRTARVSENTYFYLLPKERFLALCERNRGFSEYFTNTFGKRMIDRTYASIIKNATGAGIDASQFFNLRVEDIYHTDLLSCSGDLSIQEAAARMSENKCSSIFVTGDAGQYTGVVTDNDLRKKVIATGYDIQKPVADIMSSPLYTIAHDAMVSEALLEMMNTKLKHLAVTDAKGEVAGVVTNSDMLAAQEQSPFFIIREIASAAGVGEIIDKHARLPRLIQNMINSGAKARIITKLITSISDAILDKLIRFALDKLGPAPADFAFMILGSEGRMEQTLKTDQDNAIIFADPSGYTDPAGRGESHQAEVEQIQAYFLKLGRQVCRWLDRAGYPFCKGEIMAQNPQWCQPLSQWKAYFHNWIRVSTPQELLDSAIFFDFRWAYGNPAMVDELRLHLFSLLAGWSRFFRDLTQNALGFKPPIGFFRNFVVESKGEHRNEFDIKKAMTPVVDFARIYALRHDIAETNTQERLYRLHLEKVLSDDAYNELNQAYSWLMQQRLLCQINTIKEGKPPENYINPKKISRIEQTVFRTVFKRIEGMQTKLKLDFTAGS